jgi:phage major head subunit gpT-like protein
MNQVMALNKTLQSVYNASFDLAAKNRWASVVANEVEGAGVADIKEFLVEDLKMRVGAGVEISDLRTHALALTHAQAAGGFIVRDRDFKAQNAMQIKTDAAAALGVASSLLGQKMLLDLINSTTSKSYAGQSFFGTGHFVNYKDTSQGTYDNAVTGRDLTDVNLALAAAEIESRVMADGTPRNLKAKWLLHPPSLKRQAHIATGAEFIGSGTGTTQNVIAKKSVYDITPVQVPGLAKVGGKDVWIVAGELDGGGTFARAFGISTLIPTTITNFDGLTVPQLAIMQELEYLATGDLTAYLGHPFLVHRNTVV